MGSSFKAPQLPEAAGLLRFLPGVLPELQEPQVSSSPGSSLSDDLILNTGMACLAQEPHRQTHGGGNEEESGAGAQKSWGVGPWPPGVMEGSNSREE